MSETTWQGRGQQIDELRQHLRAREQELAEARLALDMLWQDLTEAHAAIRALREAMLAYRARAYQYAPEFPIDLDAQYETLLDGDAPAIRRASER